VFETLVGLYFRYLIAIVLALIVLSTLLVSRSAWGKRMGSPKLIVAGYLLLITFFFWMVAAPSSSNSMGYAILPLGLATAPWSFLVTWQLDKLPPGGQALVMAIVGGGINCLIFLRLFGSVHRDEPHAKRAA
jgi:hypothetical protein